MPSHMTEEAKAAQRRDAAALRELLVPGARARGTEDVAAPSYEGDYFAVQTAANRGVRRILATLHLERLEAGDAAPATEMEVRAAGAGGAAAGEQVDQELVAAMLEARREPVGFRVEERASSVEGAGDGVFVADGTVPRGAVAALYPGLVYLREHQGDGSWEESVVWSAGDGLGPERIGDYLVTRYDGTIVDGRIDASALEEADEPPGYMPFQGVERADLAKRPNPYALGHLVNHPPAGVAPNVAACPLDIAPETLPPQLLRYVPNRYWKPPGDFNRLFGMTDYLYLIRTVVFVALRDIGAGEELFVDYRFDPKRQTPEWYTPVEPRR
jgi:hypothetical protein